MVDYMRPWIHQFSIQNRVTSADREKFNWSSKGNTKFSKSKSGRNWVYLWLQLKLQGTQ